MPAYVVVLIAAALTAPVADRPPVSQRQPKAVVIEKVAASRHSINGEVSWYCKRGVSICTRGYPPGSMVGAACGRLRHALGPGWRGRRVVVSRGSRIVRITLVDRCANASRLIDLYWEPMRRLGGTGVLDVTVRW